MTSAETASTPAADPVSAGVAALNGHRADPVTFVLVHGGWHGAWCWTRLAPILRAEGHQVFTPTLTGLGDRAHLLTPDVDLSTHVRDLTALLEYEDLRDAVLVGHSYGGMVITGAVAQSPDRVAQLIFLDAFLPEEGKALADYAPLPPASADGWRIPPPVTAAQFGVTDETDAAWVDRRLGDHPLKTFTEPLPSSTGVPQSVERSFIRSTDTPWFVEAGERARRHGFRYRELLSAGHDAMLTRPRELATVLLELTESVHIRPGGRPGEQGG
ncbi:alpha/beta fold hydrolase [Naasia sp. SYSU D00948]|uniref:alpha/beta fold hydrolase n=1 Tax=Naasia sp. SYSU D00948 TaxID=2817379 RepID=UPI001B3068BD|nr:alpha/beta fold hydrolase [Naasia sp. SYSU D00948]